MNIQLTDKPKNTYSLGGGKHYFSLLDFSTARLLFVELESCI